MDWMPLADAEPKPGQFLLSEPFLDDPWFGRKVVFLCDHDEQGSLGFVLNNGMGRNLTSSCPMPSSGVLITRSTAEVRSMRTACSASTAWETGSRGRFLCFPAFGSGVNTTIWPF